MDWRLRTTLALAALLASASAAHAATITVGTTGDVVAADNVCSLREAITAAASNGPAGGCPAGDPAGVDTVLLGAGVYAISIPGTDDLNASGDFDITAGQVRIVGADV